MMQHIDDNHWVLQYNNVVKFQEDPMEWKQYAHMYVSSIGTLCTHIS